ncbi:MAG: DUF697 domain-containing protein [Gammaproteobacteria bacterium]|nr:DUF697 domain-containing protein [Gammaproteobacteria bacterium]
MVRGWSSGDDDSTGEAKSGASHVTSAQDSLRSLVDDANIPAKVRMALSTEFGQLQGMLDKLELGHIHIAVFGRVGVGKSALLNALLGRKRFSSSPLHGETKSSQLARWMEFEAGGVYFIDTPGINEIYGESRERLAHEVAGRSDLVLFVVEADLSQTELDALRLLLRENRPMLLVFNKSDRYTRKDQELVLKSLRQRCKDLLPADHIIKASAEPARRYYVHVDENGRETETTRRPAPNIRKLRETLWNILEQEGKTLSALNASLFAGRLSDTLARRVVEIKRDLGEKVVRNYCLTKGVVVGFNPVPVTDLAAAVAVDISLVVHLSRVYGLPIGRGEAGKLIATISTQMAILMGTVWTVHLLSSALKGGTLGISTIFTSATQGAVAYYSTFIVGKAAHRYFEQGKSWGETGPKRVVDEILGSLDRNSLLTEAREEIMARLKAR